MKAQIPPVVSASAINAPPCIAPSVVHRDSSHANLAVTRDSFASRTWVPSKPTNGIVLARHPSIRRPSFCRVEYQDP
jgi:hypothetical protein